MYFRENNNSRSKCPYIVFHYVNSVLYTVTNIYSKAEILLKVITIFRSENLALFTVTSIQTSKKAEKTETPKQDKTWQKIQGSTRLKEVKRQRNRVNK